VLVLKLEREIQVNGERKDMVKGSHIQQTITTTEIRCELSI